MKTKPQATGNSAAQLLHALPRLAQEVESCHSPQAAFEACLYHVCEVLGCIGGLAYTPSPDSRRLTLSCFHARKDSVGFKEFRRLSQGFFTETSPGLPSEVMRYATPRWVRDFATADPKLYPRAACDIPGIGAAVAVPVILYGKVAAVLEFIYGEALEPGEDTIAFLSCAGACVGMTVLRCYMKETLTLQQDKFKRDMEQKVRNLLDEKGRSEEAARSKTEFLANVSHELRTPMHAILSYSDLGLKKLDDNDKEKLRKYFSTIRESGQRLLALLNDLLDLSKLESNSARLEFAPHDLRAIVHAVSNELWPLMQNKKLTIDIPEHPKMNTVAEVDKVKIAQVLLNLLSNAIKFSPERGTITVAFRNLIWQEGPALAVMVIDEGVGIPPGEEDAIFEKFIQSSKTKTGAGGTGLGLAICREIIRAHNGTIYAENNMDKGSTIIFQIPLKQPEVCWLE